eukprot:Rhum_TRINITY_DN14483_c30_g1::Rhum_TRINITY_DN14483_c30_g1_i1::g.87683::m.87683
MCAALPARGRVCRADGVEPGCSFTDDAVNVRKEIVAGVRGFERGGTPLVHLRLEGHVTHLHLLPLPRVLLLPLLLLRSNAVQTRVHHVVRRHRAARGRHDAARPLRDLRVEGGVGGPSGLALRRTHEGKRSLPAHLPLQRLHEGRLHELRVGQPLQHLGGLRQRLEDRSLLRVRHLHAHAAQRLVCLQHLRLRHLPGARHVEQPEQLPQLLPPPLGRDGLGGAGEVLPDVRGAALLLGLFPVEAGAPLALRLALLVQVVAHLASLRVVLPLRQQRLVDGHLTRPRVLRLLLHLRRHLLDRLRLLRLRELLHAPRRRRRQRPEAVPAVASGGGGGGGLGRLRVGGVRRAAEGCAGVGVAAAAGRRRQRRRRHPLGRQPRALVTRDAVQRAFADDAAGGVDGRGKGEVPLGLERLLRQLLRPLAVGPLAPLANKLHAVLVQPLGEGRVVPARVRPLPPHEVPPRLGAQLRDVVDEPRRRDLRRLRGGGRRVGPAHRPRAVLVASSAPAARGGRARWRGARAREQCLAHNTPLLPRVAVALRRRNLALRRRACVDGEEVVEVRQHALLLEACRLLLLDALVEQQLLTRRLRRRRCRRCGDVGLQPVVCRVVAAFNDAAGPVREAACGVHRRRHQNGRRTPVRGRGAADRRGAAPCRLLLLLL